MASRFRFSRRAILGPTPMRALSAKVGWIVFRPTRASCSPVRRQEFAPPGLRVSSSALIERRPSSAWCNKNSRAIGSGRLRPTASCFGLIGCGERLGRSPLTRTALFQFEDPVKADRGRPISRQLRLERRLVELRVAEGGEGRGPSLHGLRMKRCWLTMASAMLR